jgi:hypothetical protein
MGRVMRWLAIAFLVALLEMFTVWTWLTYSYSVVVLLVLTAVNATLLTVSLELALSLIWRARKVGYRPT